jgi:DNA-binding MarR family transcriptional regulator
MMQPPLDGLDPRRLRLVHALRAISVELELARAEFARTHGLHDTDVRALIHLLDAQRAGTLATAGWLGNQLGLSSASATGLIDRMERAGHVRRQRSARDRRQVEVVVTDSAVELGWSFFGPLLAAMVQAMEPFDSEELDTVERFLSQVVLAPGTRTAPRRD